MNPHYPVVAHRAGHRCEYYRAPEVIFNFPFEVEHITPRSAEGGEEATNLSLACRSCNVYKADRRECKDPESGDYVPLYHPRIDVWDEHFHWNLDTGLILGRSATGRATVACLQMNSPVHVYARRRWAELDLFP